jgi:nucleoside transporter
MKSTTRIQLSGMMFLNFFIWGIWFVTMGTYLTKGPILASDADTGLAYGTQSLGAIIAPMVIGMIADRFFSAQRVLGVLHIAGAILMYLIAEKTAFGSFYSLLLIYMIIYMPTLALVNAVALKQVSNAEKEFSFIRMWGTIGWIVAGLVIAWANWEKNPGDLSMTFKTCAIVSAFMGIYSFFLPNTPAPKAGQKVSLGETLGLDALRLLGKKNYLIFFLASMLICIPLAFYYQETNKFLGEVGVQKAAGKMIWGQIAEAAFLFIMPWFFFRFNIKKMLLFGMLAWVLRYLLFGFGDAGSNMWMLYLGIILHGICYDFFFVTGQIYTDKVAGPRIRASAQGLITLATYGVGMLVGFWIAGQVVGQHKTGNTHDWKTIWMYPAAIAGAITLLFLLFFRDKSEAKTNP